MSKALPFVTSLAVCAVPSGCDSSYAKTFPPPPSWNGGDWRDEVIYQAIIDRFADGDINNNHRVYRAHSDATKAATGKASSITSTTWTLLVSRRCGSRRSSRTSTTTRASTAITATGRSRLRRSVGTLDRRPKLRELVDKAHQHKMKVVLDIVTNHVGQLFYYDINGNGQPTKL